MAEHQEVMYTVLPGSVRSRPIRDSDWRAWLWLILWSVPGMFLAATSGGDLWRLLPGFGMMIAGIVGFWRGRFDSLYRYPRVWAADLRSRFRNDRTYSDEEGEYSIANFFDALGTIYRPGYKTDTMWLTVDGYHHANDGPIGAVSALEAFVEVWKRVVAVMGVDLFVTYHVGSRPWDPIPSSTDVSENFLHRKVVEAAHNMPDELPEGDMPKLSAAERGANNMNQVYRVCMEQGAQPLYAFAITVKRPPTWKQFTKRPEDFSVEHLQRSLLMRVMKTMQTGMERAGFTGVQLMSYREQRQNIRTIYDPHYVTNKLDGLDVDRQNVWPDAIYYDRAQRLLCIKNQEDPNQVSYHNIFVARGFRSKKALWGKFYEMFANLPRWVNVSVPVRTVSQNIEEFLLKRKQGLVNAIQRDHYSEGMMQTLEDLDAAQEANDRIDRIYLSGSRPARFGLRIHIYGDSLNQYRQAEEEMQARARHNGVNLRAIRSRTRKTRAVLAAITGTPE